MPAEPLALGALVQGRGFAHGHPLGSTEGFVPGCWAACGLLKTGKGKTCHPSPPSCCTRPRCPLQVFTRQPGCSPGTAVCQQSSARTALRGEQDLPTDVYWQFAYVAKKPGGSRRDPAPGDCPCSGRGSPGPPLPAAPRAPLSSFPRPRSQLCPEQTGLFAHAGISRSLCSFDFLFPLCQTLLWGLQRGLGPPPCPWKARFASHASTDILGVPTEHIWVACGDSSCVTEPHSPPNPGVFLLFPPSPSLTPGTSCCLQHLGKVGANGCPCSRIPSTLHPVRRGGNLGTGIRPAVQPRGPRLASCPLPEPGLPGRNPRVALGSLCLTHCPRTLSLYSTQHPWDWAGARSRSSPPHPPLPSPGMGSKSWHCPFQQRNTRLPTGTGSCCLPASGIVVKNILE